MGGVFYIHGRCVGWRQDEGVIMIQVHYKFDTDTSYFVTDKDCLNCAFIHPSYGGVRVVESEIDGVDQADSFVVMDDFGNLVPTYPANWKFARRN